MPVSAPSTALNEAFLASIIQSRDVTVNGIAAVANLVAKLPSGPDLGALPFVNQLPAPRDVVDAQFALVDELVSAQRAVAYRFVDLLEQTPA